MNYLTFSIWVLIREKHLKEKTCTLSCFNITWFADRNFQSYLNSLRIQPFFEDSDHLYRSGRARLLHMNFHMKLSENTEIPGFFWVFNTLKESSLKDCSSGSLWLGCSHYHILFFHFWISYEQWLKCGGGVGGVYFAGEIAFCFQTKGSFPKKSQNITLERIQTVNKSSHNLLLNRWAIQHYNSQSTFI